MLSAHILPSVTLAEASPTLWYLTRATAFSAYLLLTASVILGMLRSIARTAHERLSWVVDEVHQYAGTLMVVMMLLHLITLYLDPFLPFTIVNLLVPANEPYRPTGVNFGVFAFYTVVGVAASSWLRRFIAYRAWRLLHYLSFIAFALVTAHGWLSGSDSDEPWMHAIYLASAASVAFLVLVRLVSGASSAPATTA
jgi:methionine sulfoxide reductase heme-binding subunit